jgi:hypothetical protein
MAKAKTTGTQKNVIDFINETVDTEQKKQDSYDLVKLMTEISGEQAKIWGSSIIGFGKYHYKYNSGHEGEAPLIGFSPRKAAISLYVFTGLEEHEHLLQELGKYKIGKACIYIKQLSDIDAKKLKSTMKETIKYLTNKYSI